jgi:hypothetical protein
MLRLPICGFSRRVEDTVARAMAILKTRPDYTTGSRLAEAIHAGLGAQKGQKKAQ